MLVSSVFLSSSTSLSMPEKVEQPLKGECESLSQPRKTARIQGVEKTESLKKDKDMESLHLLTSLLV